MSRGTFSSPLLPFTLSLVRTAFILVIVGTSSSAIHGVRFLSALRTLFFILKILFILFSSIFIAFFSQLFAPFVLFAIFSQNVQLTLFFRF